MANPIEELMNSEVYKAQLSLHEQRSKTIKKGANVVHLEYIGELDIKDLAELQDELAKVNLELSSYNKSGFFTASLQDFTLTSFLVLSQPILQEILKNSVNSATWDVIKYCLLKIWSKVKGTTYSNGREKKELKFGVKLQMGSSSLQFNLEGDCDKETVVLAIDKILDFAREQQVQRDQIIADYCQFSKDTKKWRRIDVMAEIRNIAERQAEERQRRKDND